MAIKTFSYPNLGEVVVVKRRSSRHIRLSLSVNGGVRVSIPAWAPYKAGTEFALAKQDWIMSQRPKSLLLTNSQPIGKSHLLEFIPSDNLKPQTRILNDKVIIKHPKSLANDHPIVQTAAKSAAIRTLKKQGEQLLFPRLDQLAKAKQVNYSSVQMKQLTRRWGSCDSHHRLVFNIFLLQLPWELIDYVIFHELAHTKALDHGPVFWQQVEAFCPDYKQRKKAIKGYQPTLLNVIN